MDMLEKISFDLEKEKALVTAKLKNIDQFNMNWRSLELTKPKQELKELKQLSTIQSIGSSTRIEGSSLSDDEVQKLIQDLEIKEMKSRDEQEVAGYLDVLDLIFENYQEIFLSESYIKQLHNLLLKYSDKDTRHKGEYKSLSNKVVARYSDGNSRIVFNTTEPYLVKSEMEALIQWTSGNLNSNNIHPLIVIGAFIYEFLSIHPFQDGNGRLSRLLTTFLMMKLGYSFIQYISFEHVIEERKKEYYQSLMQCQKHRYSSEENIGQWMIFFLDCIENLIVRLQTKLNQKKIHKSSSPNTRYKDIVQVISSSNGIKIGEIHEQLEISKNTLKKDLIELLKQGLIEKHGRGRGSFYSIKTES